MIDEIGKKYICPHSDTCSKRRMGYKEMCMHMSTTHDVVGEIMAKDGRMGMENVLSMLFPNMDYRYRGVQGRSSPCVKTNVNAKTVMNVKQEQSVKTDKDHDHVSTSPAPIRRRPGPASRVKTEPSQARVHTTTREEEDVDDPLSIGISPPKISQTIKAESSRDQSPPLPPPKIDRVQNCLVCRGEGRANKEGRNLNFAEGLQDSKYHYAVCYYNEGAFVQFVDPGEINKTVSGEPLEEFGMKYKYKCPFPTCSRNTGRGAGKLMGYKEYSIHCGVAHNLLEKVMEVDDRDGIKDVMAALKYARKKEGVKIEEMPPPQVEQVHRCLLCKGETKDGKNLSFHESKRLQLRYHYASCYYESGVYLARYPPGEQNMDEEGNPRDILGRDIKYSCEVRGCTIKRKMGYKEFCIHMSNEHRGILEVLREDGRPELLEIADLLDSDNEDEK